VLAAKPALKNAPVRASSGKRNDRVACNIESFADGLVCSGRDQHQGLSEQGQV